MNKEIFLTDFQANLPQIVKAVLSDAADRSPGSASRILIRPIALRGEIVWQFERLVGNKAYHENLPLEQALRALEAELPGFRQASLTTAGLSYAYSFYGKKAKRRAVANHVAAQTQPEHNKQKQYLLPEGEAIPALVDLGVFTPQYRIVRSKYDKYRQINRFLELVDNALPKDSHKHLHILDFGCGKSYLTFILYYHLTVHRRLDVTITGYDLKADVVAHCNQIAAKYGYNQLHFVCGDIGTDAAGETDIDMIVTLHACDTATDYALYFALERQVPYIFSVPCCQHEINLHIRRGGGDLDLFLSHGLFQERMSALLTDAIRTEILHACGYNVDVIEFTGFEHTPKNIMLRCTLRRQRKPDLQALEQLAARYGFSQTLLRLVAGRTGTPLTVEQPDPDV